MGLLPAVTDIPRYRTLIMGARDENHSGDHNLAFSTWSLLKLTDHLLNQGVVDDISHEGLRVLLREEGVSCPIGQDVEDLDRS